MNKEHALQIIELEKFINENNLKLKQKNTKNKKKKIKENKKDKKDIENKEDKKDIENKEDTTNKEDNKNNSKINTETYNETETETENKDTNTTNENKYKNDVVNNITNTNIKNELVNSDNNVINSNNNNTNTNITNNIIINNYGEENLSYLSDEDIKDYIIDQTSGLLKCIKDIHFNPEHPENKNIRLLNKKQPYLQVLKNNKWEFRIKKDELVNILKNRYIYLEDHYNNIKDELSEEELKILDEYKKDYSYIFNLFAENEKKLELLIITNK